MRIVLSGGNGYLGRRLAERWVEAGHDVVVLTRSPGAQAGCLHHNAVRRLGDALRAKSAADTARGILRSAQDDARPPISSPESRGKRAARGDARPPMQAGCLHHKVRDARPGAQAGCLHHKGRTVQAGRLHYKVREVEWDGKTLGDWTGEIDGADVLVNLAGRSVNCRYNEFNKGVIRSSRVDSTRVLGEAVQRAACPPSVWLNSSTATIYRHAEDRAMDDETGEIGRGFSVDVATAWEQEFFSSSTVGVRKVALRTAMVMGRGEGGPFSVFETLVRRGLGGRMGDGRQMVSWVHFEDFARAIEFLIESDVSGTVNVCAPGPLRNDAFMKEICSALGAKVALPSPRWLLEVGALVIGTETELPLKSRWVVPSRLLGLGFEFLYQTWPQGVRGIVGAGVEQVPSRKS